MTNKEIMERHGKVEDYKMEEFMTFNDFKAMPKDIQAEYVNKLQDKYDINLHHISRFLFNIGDEGLQSHLRINGILKDCNPDKRRSKTGLVQFQNDIKESREKKTEPKKLVPLGEFVAFEEYMRFDPEDKVAYVNSIIEKYDVGVGQVSHILFGKSTGTLDNWFANHNLRERILKVGKTNPSERTAKNQKFEKAVAAWKGLPTEKVAAPAEDIKTEPVVVAPVAAANVEKPVDITNCGMVFRQEYVGDGVELDRLKALVVLFEGKRVNVKIEIAEVA